MITQFFASGGQTRGRRDRRQSGGKLTEVKVAADTRSRTVLVRCGKDDFEEISRLIETLNKAGATGAVALKIIPLQSADARQVAGSLGRIFRERQRAMKLRPEESVSVQAEAGSNSLIVSGPANSLAEVEAMAKQLDAAQPKVAVEIRIFELKNAQADRIANTLRTIITQAGRGVTLPSGRRAGEHLIELKLVAPGSEEAALTSLKQQVQVTADANSNRLIVTAEAGSFPIIAALVKSLDDSATQLARELRVLPLKQAAAGEVARMLTRIEQSRSRALKQQVQITVAADTRTNTLVIDAPAREFDRISKLIAKLDVEPEALGVKVRLITVKNADAAAVATVVQQFFTDQAVAQQRGRVRRRPQPGGTGKIGEVTVHGEPRTGTVIVRCGEEDFKLISELIAKLDTPGATGDRLMKVVSLEFLDARFAARTLANIFRQIEQAKPAQVRKESDKIVISPEAATNSLVISATKENMAAIDELIAKLDVEKAKQEFALRIYPLQNAQAARAAQTLTRLFTRLIQQRRATTVSGRPRFEAKDIISVVPDTRTNSLIVSTDEKSFPEIEKLIKLLDAEPVAPEAVLAILPLKYATAGSLAKVINNAINNAASVRITGGKTWLTRQIQRLKIADADGKLLSLELTDQIKITAEPGTNSLVIWSSRTNVAVLTALTKLLDVVPLGEKILLRLVVLENADAEDVAKMLTALFREGKKMARPKVGPKVVMPEGAMGKALVSSVNFAADARTNTLILSGLGESLALVEAMIRRIDEAPTKAEAELRIFSLTHAKADEVATTLNRVFSAALLPPGKQALREQVIRLKFGRKTASLRPDQRTLRDAIKVTAEIKTNSLVVMGSSRNVALAGELIKTLDIEPVSRVAEVGVVPLSNADAGRLVSVIDKIMKADRKAVAADPYSISADPRTNAIVISGSTARIRIVSNLCEKLDATAAISLLGVRVVTLKNADAAVVATNLGKMFDARRKRAATGGQKLGLAEEVVIAPDTRSNMMLVMANEENFALITKMCKTLDDAPPALAGKIHLIELKNTDATRLAATLNQLFTARVKQTSRTVGDQDKVVIVGDLRSNMLIVSASDANRKLIVEMAAKMDALPPSPATTIRMKVLVHGDAARLAPLLERLFKKRLAAVAKASGRATLAEDEVAIAADQRTNSLLVSCNKENFEVLENLLKTLDSSDIVTDGDVYVFGLENADAAKVAQILLNMFKNGVRTRRPGTPMRPEDRVVATGDERTNSVIVGVSRDNVSVIKKLIKQLDAADTIATVQIKLFSLTNGDATKIAGTLQGLFDGKRRQMLAAGLKQSELDEPISVTADERTNMLIVSASRTGFAAIEPLIKELDAQPDDPTGAMEILPLQFANAVELAPTLQKMFDERRKRQRAQTVKTATDKDMVTITADRRTNSLLVSANRDDQAMVKGLVDILDKRPEALAGPVQIYPLKKADCRDVASTLTQLYTSRKGSPGQPLTPVSFAADTRSNAVICSAAKSDHQEIAMIIQRLDGLDVARVSEIRIFPLEHARAVDVAKVLSTTFGLGGAARTAPAGRGRTSSATLVKFSTTDKRGVPVVHSAFKEDVQITTDERINALVVSAPSDLMVMVERLIKTLGREPTTRIAHVKIFTLENADAGRMVKTLNDLFAKQLKSSQDRAAGKTAGLPGAPGEEVTRLTIADGKKMREALLEEFTITADLRTNSIIATGGSEYLGIVEKLLKEIDSSNTQERQTTVYRLRNAIAENVAKILTDFFQHEKQTLTALGGQSAAVLAARTDVSVVADKETNSLMIAATPRYMDEVMGMIKELDAKPPQVLIQAMLVEVTLDDESEFGIEFALTAAKRGGTQKYDLSTSLSLGFATSGGIKFSSVSGDFDLFLRALKSEGRLEVLSRPQILASDNKEAVINVGEEVPRINTTRVTDQGTTFSTVTYEKVGIILKVTPQINPDGFVNMDVEPTISSLTDSTVQISEGVSAPIYTNRSAHTVVSIKDGQTIVIGGLITQTTDEDERKVPLLGDLPGPLGWPFRHTTKKKRKTELLIILTPHVVRDEHELQTVSDRERRRTGMITKNFSKDGRIGDLLNGDTREGSRQGGTRVIDIFSRNPKKQPANAPTTRPAETAAPTTRPTVAPPRPFPSWPLKPKEQHGTRPAVPIAAGG